jgi:hypothetical protein
MAQANPPHITDHATEISSILSIKFKYDFIRYLNKILLLSMRFWRCGRGIVTCIRLMEVGWLEPRGSFSGSS